MFDSLDSIRSHENRSTIFFYRHPKAKVTCISIYQGLVTHLVNALKTGLAMPRLYCNCRYGRNRSTELADDLVLTKCIDSTSQRSEALYP